MANDTGIGRFTGPAYPFGPDPAGVLGPKADIKPGSRPQLEEMAKLLKKDPRLSVFIVGHTDDRGTVAYNLDLSKRRAEAVVRALATEHNVDARQIMPKGLANFAPITSNEDESGRAKNRRVELVKQ